MSETKSNGNVRKKPVERSSAADHPASTKRRRDDVESRSVKGGESVKEGIVVSELDDTEWLNIAFDSILKKFDAPQASDHVGDGVSDIAASSSGDRQNPSSLSPDASNPIDDAEDIFRKQAFPDKASDSMEPFSYDEAKDILTKDASQINSADQPQEDTPKPQKKGKKSHSGNAKSQKSGKKSHPGHRQFSEDAADKTAGIHAKQSISDTFESSPVSVSDEFSFSSADTSDMMEGFSNDKEGSDTMENIFGIANKKTVKAKDNESGNLSEEFSEIQDEPLDDNTSTIVISLRAILAFISKNIVIVLLTALICSMVGYLFTQKYVKQKYVSNTKIIIFTAEPNAKMDPSWDDLQLSFTLLTDCSQIIKSRDVLEDVIEELELSYSYYDLLDNIDVSFMSNSRIIEISVTDEDPLMAMTIVKKLREVSMRYITDNLEVSDSKIIQKENIPHHPLSSHTLYYVVIGGIIGIIVSSVALSGIYIIRLENEFWRKQQEAGQSDKPVDSKMIQNQ